MDGRLAIAQRLRTGAGKYRLDFRDEGKRQLFRRFRAEIETGRRKELGLDRNPFIQHRIQQLVAALPRPEQTDVGQIELK